MQENPYAVNQEIASNIAKFRNISGLHFDLIPSLAVLYSNEES